MSQNQTLKPLVRLQTPKPPLSAELQPGERKGVQSVERAFDILRIVEASAGPVGVAEIAQALDSSPSKVHHYLVSLVRCGALRQTGRGAYDLGTTSLGLGLSALSRLDTVDRTCEVAETLRDEIGEAVFVAVWGNRGPTIIRYFEGFKPLTVEARAGLVLPILTSATGRVFLAWGNEKQIVPLVAEEGDVKADAIKNAVLKADIGFVDGDLLPRIASLSAPVFAYNSDLSLAVTVLGWSGEYDHAPHGAVAQTLRAACQTLSKEFGR
ncbi:IclR family transcriptional regulator [Yoonia sp. SS1-5]|uniref:IclR family transcriptional regulator n=1 Tax=Yoonia rhodophyticola TaxID=3137370 RepID=A0AAN0M805_9RHOB